MTHRLDAIQLKPFAPHDRTVASIFKIGSNKGVSFLPKR